MESMQLKINELENQIKVLSLSAPASNNLFQPMQRVKLNVGGQIFETTVEVLTKYSESMLGAMFSGRFFVEVDKEGCYFLDRDGTSFRYILNFLRDGIVPRKLLKPDLEQLLNEAEYFGIDALIKAINAIPINNMHADPITVQKHESVPDGTYELGLPLMKHRLYHTDTTRGYEFYTTKPLTLLSAQLLVQGDQPFSVRAVLFQTDSEASTAPKQMLQQGSLIENCTSAEPKWIHSHFSSMQLATNRVYCILWEFVMQSGYIFYTEWGPNPQPGRLVGPLTVFARNCTTKWTIVSNYYNIRMRIVTQEV